jgi:hypothetical protein
VLGAVLRNMARRGRSGQYWGAELGSTQSTLGSQYLGSVIGSDGVQFLKNTRITLDSALRSGTGFGTRFSAGSLALGSALEREFGTGFGTGVSSTGSALSSY